MALAQKLIAFKGEETVMLNNGNSAQVLYSYPHKIGGRQIDAIAWQHVKYLAAAGADVLECPGAVHRALPPGIQVWPTLARWKLRIPYRLLGRIRACALHDWIVARQLEKLTGQVDIVHTWPMAALQTIKTGKRLGIPVVMEQPGT